MPIAIDEGYDYSRGVPKRGCFSRLSLARALGVARRPARGTLARARWNACAHIARWRWTVDRSRARGWRRDDARARGR